MLPAINAITAYIPPPPTIVATVIPGNNTVRVPADNVSPPVSNVQIDNNARGNNVPFANTSSAASTLTLSMPAFSSFTPLFNGTPTTLSLSAQTTFFAQLMSQDNSSLTQGMLSEYERIVAMSQVKYKPSNAMMPEPEPMNLFSQILQQEKTVRVAQQFTEPQAVTSPAIHQAAAAVSTPASTRTPESPSRTTRNAALATTPSKALPSVSLADKLHATHAYVATTIRNNKTNQESIESV